MDHPSRELYDWVYGQCRVFLATEGWYNIIIGRGLLTTLGIDIDLSYNNIECSELLYQGWAENMVKTNG